MTPFPAQRMEATPRDFGTPTLVVTITLTDPPLRRAALLAANNLGSPELQLLIGVYWVYLIQQHEALITTLTQAPFDAEIVDQSYIDENTITVRIQADRTAQIAALPGVLSAREGANPPPPPQETPSRDTFQPGTRMPPLQPPGYDQGG